ncbi:sulfur carrier protein [Arthrobacter pigmenti]|uniref:Sulfur carrier protein n=1 Tax=Arthrobacter pigmenti TaxID=271432 RepID=A0A846RPJ2_9MICC|nr:sulfur carrier protein ThiS [Arthrobacter pigmenti]NJC22999.1 sulfur carrier protein [Arthrobacter pigmenti]
MNITLNGKASETSDADLLALVSNVTGRKLAPSGQPIDGARLGLAVAVNATVVPRSQWAERELTEGDDVELVTAVQGG